MQRSVETYLSYLFDSRRTELRQLSEEDLITLTSKILKETHTKNLPAVEIHDKERDMCIMMAEWMETEDDRLGYQILSKMRDLTVKATECLIAEKLAEYISEQQIAIKETDDHINAESKAFDKQRI